MTTGGFLPPGVPVPPGVPPLLAQLAEIAEKQLEQQQKNRNDLDTKASILIGFSGVLLAQIVKASLPSSVTKIAIATTSLAAAFGVLSYLPYRFDQIDTAAFRNRLDRFDPIDLAEGLTNYRLQAIQANSRRLRRKARGVRMAAVLLLSTVTTISGSILGVWTGLHDAFRALPWQ
jgi:hypothetical protein